MKILLPNSQLSHALNRWQQAKKFVKPRNLLIEFDNLVSLIKRKPK